MGEGRPRTAHRRKALKTGRLWGLGRSDEGIFKATLTVYSKYGGEVGTVIMGEERVRRGFSTPGKRVIISQGPTHWAVLREDNCRQVCRLDKVHVHKHASIHVTLSMWLAGRPVHLTPQTSNLTDLERIGQPQAPCPNGCIVLRQGVSITHDHYEIPPLVQRLIG